MVFSDKSTKIIISELNLRFASVEVLAFLTKGKYANAGSFSSSPVFFPSFLFLIFLVSRNTMERKDYKLLV